MSDLAKAVKDAVYARLSGQVGAPVYDTPPEGAVVPVVLIDSVSSAAPLAKGDALRLLTVSLVAFTQARSRDGLRAILAAIISRLDGYKPSAGTVTFGDFMAGDTSEETLGDGLTHVGRITFTVFAQ